MLERWLLTGVLAGWGSSLVRLLHPMKRFRVPGGATEKVRYRFIGRQCPFRRYESLQCDVSCVLPAKGEL